MKIDAATPAGIVHDIRNLLTIVSLNSSILAISKVTNQRVLAGEIATAVDSMGQLLSLLEPQSAQSRPRVAVPISRTVSQVVALMRPLFPSVDFVVAENEPAVYGSIDEVHLFRCVMNLASNAAEAAMENTRKTPRVELTIGAEQGASEICVSDSGNGFANSGKDVFKPFVSIRDQQSNHRGLGLYVVQSIVQEYRGCIEINRVGDTTQVTVRFPMRQRGFIVDRNRAKVTQSLVG